MTRFNNYGYSNNRDFFFALCDEIDAHELMFDLMEEEDDRYCESLGYAFDSKLTNSEPAWDYIADLRLAREIVETTLDRLHKVAENYC